MGELLNALSRVTPEEWAKAGGVLGALLGAIALGFWKFFLWAGKKANEPLMKEVGKAGAGRDVNGTTLRARIEEIGDNAKRAADGADRAAEGVLLVDKRFLRLEKTLDDSAVQIAAEFARVHARIDSSNTHVAKLEAIIQLRQAEKRDPANSPKEKAGE
jgi:hypothetical protein